MKILGKIILVLVGLFVAITLLGLWGPKVAGWWRDYQYGLQVQQAEEMIREREVARKNDTIGGKTPEETFDLFITALKAGNTLQASKYYELSVQLKALSNLQAELAKEGNLEKSVTYFTDLRTKGERWCNEKGDGCTFRFTGSDGYDRIVDLGKNNSSGVWKVEQPF